MGIPSYGHRTQKPSEEKRNEAAIRSRPIKSRASGLMDSNRKGRLADRDAKRDDNTGKFQEVLRTQYSGSTCTVHNTPYGDYYHVRIPN